MIGWLIVLGILALLLGLLLSPLVFALDYDDPKDRFFWKLSWLGIPLLSSEGKGVFRKKTGKPERTGDRRKTGTHRQKGQAKAVLENRTEQPFCAAETAAAFVERAVAPASDCGCPGGQI